MWVVLLCLDIC